MKLTKWIKAVFEDRRVMKVLGFHKSDFVKIR